MEPVEKAASHVLAVSRITLYHLLKNYQKKGTNKSDLVCRLKACIGDLSHAQRLVVSFIGADHWRVSHQGEVDPELL